MLIKNIFIVFDNIELRGFRTILRHNNIILEIGIKINHLILFVIYLILVAVEVDQGPAVVRDQLVEAVDRAAGRLVNQNKFSLIRS